MRRKSLVAGVLAFGLVIGLAPAALAGTVERSQFDNAYPFDASSMCGFPVAGQAHTWGWYTALSDPSGNPILEQDQIWEEDTLVGTTHSITSVPYRYNGHFRYASDGSFIMGAGTGGIAHFVLPDGTAVWAAGRIDYVTGKLVGNPGNSAALCAYLDS